MKNQDCPICNGTGVSTGSCPACRGQGTRKVYDLVRNTLADPNLVDQLKAQLEQEQKRSDDLREAVILLVDVFDLGPGSYGYKTLQGARELVQADKRGWVTTKPRQEKRGQE